MSKGPGLLTLTTDFGTVDGYSGAVKGRVLSIAPGVQVVDISHEITPQNIGQGAWCLRRAVPRFPPGTVHLAVVDPGVGSSRSGVVIETENYLLVGPDNGLLSLAAADDGIVRLIEISEDREEWYKSPSFDALTFFAPVAGHLLAGISLDEVGPEAEDLVEWPDPQVKVQGNVIEGAVTAFDRFGNAATNIPSWALDDREVEHIYLKAAIDVTYCDHYAQLAGGVHVGAIVNSDGRLELTRYSGSLQQAMNIQVGDPVRVLLRPY